VFSFFFFLFSFFFFFLIDEKKTAKIQKILKKKNTKGNGTIKLD
jgi:hypothetical protein